MSLRKGRGVTCLLPFKSIFIYKRIFVAFPSIFYMSLDSYILLLCTGKFPLKKFSDFFCVIQTTNKKNLWKKSNDNITTRRDRGQSRMLKIFLYFFWYKFGQRLFCPFSGAFYQNRKKDFLWLGKFFGRFFYSVF